MQTKELKEALRVCAMVAPTRTPSEIYTYALIADGKISASDGESYISTPIKSDLNVLIPIKTMQEICSGSSQDVSISLVGNNLKVKAGKSSYSLPTMDPSKFPKPMQTSEELARVNGELLQDAIGLCLPTVDALAVRGGIGGLCIHSGDHGVRLLSSCNHGFSSMFISREPSKKFTESIPPKQMAILKSIATNLVSIHYSGNSVTFICNQTRFTSPTIAGQYPVGLFEKQFDKHVASTPTATFSSSELSENVRQVGIVLNLNRHLRLRMSGSTLSMKCEENGSASESDVNSLDGTGEWNCIVGQQFLLSSLKSMDEHVEVGRNYPIVFVKSGEKLSAVTEMSDA